MSEIVTYLLVVGGPILAIGAAAGIAKPVGRWVGRWLGVDEPERFEDDEHSISSRIAILEQAVSAISDNLDRVLVAQRETEALKQLSRSKQETTEVQ